MSIPVLVEVYDEMRRLAIAGSAVGPGDFRLKRLTPALVKSGEKAPVFIKVAQAVQALVDSDEKTASPALLELTTLVNAILYTQGDTGIAGEFKPLETTELGAAATQVSARILKPLLEALQSTGSGRVELIRDAFEQGYFNDLRLIKPALGAIDDPYPDIAAFVVENVLPMYGKAILPELREKLDFKGRAGHLHRLRLLHRLDPEGSRPLVQSALSDGSKEMKVAAVECLGKSEQDLAYLLEQTKSRAKDVRVAAVGALLASGISTPEVIAAAKKAIYEPDLVHLVAAMRRTGLTEIRRYVLAQAREQLDLALKSKDPKPRGEAITWTVLLVACLDGSANRESETFLLHVFAQAAALGAIKSEPSGADLNELVAYLMFEGTPAMRKTLGAAHRTLRGSVLRSSLLAARATMTALDFFAEFSPLLAPSQRARKGSAEQERGEALVVALNGDDEIGYNNRWIRLIDGGRRGEPRELPALDPRWLDVAIEAGVGRLVYRLARPGHAGVKQFLSDQLGRSGRAHDAYLVLRTMVEVQHPGAADALIDALQTAAKDSTTYFTGYWHARMIPELPRSAYPKFEALLPTLPDRMVDKLLDSVMALKDKPE